MHDLTVMPSYLKALNIQDSNLNDLDVFFMRFVLLCSLLYQEWRGMAISFLIKNELMTFFAVCWLILLL